MKRIVNALLAPAVAIVLSVLLTMVVLAVAGSSVGDFVTTLFQAPEPRNVVNILNNASVLYLSGLAAAIGFRMGLFNIGVEGQYLLAVFCAAAFAGAGWLPGPLNLVATILVAMMVGAAWAMIAALLKVTRGISEVISTIMLNSIALSLAAYFLHKVGVIKGNILLTKEVPEGGRMPGIPLVPGAPNDVYGFIVVAVLLGVAYWFVLNRTTFGFNLRATGASATAAEASGVDVRRMVVIAMAISGAIAGLVGLPILLGNSYAYSTAFQTGLGFTGIAVALLGRNHPIGIAFGALLFAFLTEQSIKLELDTGVSDNIVLITQGVIVMSVVIAYELVRRWSAASEQRSVAAQLADSRTDAPVEVAK